MKFFGLIAFFVGFAVIASEASAKWETSANVNPRFESIYSSVPDWARRGFLKTTVLSRNEDVGLNVEGFVERDIAQTALEPFGQPDLRKSRSTEELQELYFDAKYDSFFVRVGRQPVRWSQSWTLPSLDVFTGRRFNRLFVDPVPEQLSHPDGILVSYAGSVIEADVFHAVQTAETTFPQPLPDIDRKIRDQTGARLKFRFGGFDVALVGYRNPDDELGGASVSYAFESVVLRAEGGARSHGGAFGLGGLDYFGNIGDLEINFSPQATWFDDPLVTSTNLESIYYVPLRLTYKRTSFEGQYYLSPETNDKFGSLMLTRDISDYKGASLKVSVFHQSYLGQPGRLFSIYESMTGSSLAGIRFDVNYTL